MLRVAEHMGFGGYMSCTIINSNASVNTENDMKEWTYVFVCISTHVKVNSNANVSTGNESKGCTELKEGSTHCKNT